MNDAVLRGFVFPVLVWRQTVLVENLQIVTLSLCTAVPMPVPLLVAQTSWMHVGKLLKIIQLSCLVECSAVI